MNIAKQKTIFFRLQTVSPVHIGSDEVYEPTAFVVDETKRQLISFDPADFINMLDSDALAEFSALCQKGTPQSLVGIYRFMNRHKNLVAGGHPVAVSDAFIKHFQDTMKLNGGKNILQNLNKYQIKRTAFHPHEDIPYIPGSSIKGSIRTAVLNYRNKGKSHPGYTGKNASSRLEQDLVGGSFATDPFRLVKVSDFVPVGEVRRRIVYGVNRKKKPSKFEARGPEQIFEVVEPGAVFFGSITIAEVPRNAGINKPVTKKELTDALLQFFGNEKKRGNNELKAVEIPPATLDLSANQFPVRIGFHSGAECVTVDGHRKIKIKGKGRDFKIEDHATTFWLAAESKNSANQQLRPFGWVTMEELSTEEVSGLQEQLEKERQARNLLQQEIFQQQQQEAHVRKEQLRAQQEKEKQKQVEAAAQAEKTEALRVSWQAMTEEEQDLAIVRGEEIAKSQASGIDIMQTIWPKLDSADQEHQKALAQAFMERWQQEGMWKVKKKKKAQWPRVQRIKTILGLN